MKDIANLLKIRKNEVEVLVSILGRNKFKPGIKILEIGCGNTFSAGFFPGSSLVVCTDLPDKNVVHNKQDICESREAASSLGLAKIKFLGCSGLKLPFKENTFDLVFSQYVLEHIKDKNSCIMELARVLKKDGLIISLVPNFIERFYEFPRYYLYLLKRIIKKLFRSPRLKGDVPFKNQEIVRLRNFFDYYPSFPFIEPHGEYKNAVQEFIAHLPFNWAKLFKKLNLEVTDVFSTNFLPWNLLDTVSYRLTNDLYSRSKRLTRVLGKTGIIKYLGYSLCIVASKKGALN